MFNILRSLLVVCLPALLQLHFTASLPIPTELLSQLMSQLLLLLERSISVLRELLLMLHMLPQLLPPPQLLMLPMLLPQLLQLLMLLSQLLPMAILVPST